MTKLLEMQEKRSQLIAEAQRVVLQDKIDAEARAKFDRMMTDVEQMEGDIDRLRRIEKLEAESRATVRPPRPNPDAEAAPSEERKKLHAKAFERYIRYGKGELAPEERAILREYRDVTTTGASGNVAGATMIPQQFLTTLIDAQKLVGNTVSVVAKKVTDNNGAPIKVALSNDTGNSLTTLTLEDTVLTEQDPAFSGFTMQTDTVATLVKVSIQELEDSYFDLNAWLREKFGIRYYRGLEYLITNGNASNVASIVTGATLGANVAAASGPVFSDFVACYGSQDPAYIPNSKWLFSSVTRAYIMGLKDNYGRPLFIVSPNSGTLDQILGCPVVMNQVLPSAVNVSTTATATGILFGDFEQGYLLRTDGGISILRLDERYADSLMVGFIGYSRVGGASIDAGTHPIRTMVTPIA